MGLYEESELLKIIIMKKLTITLATLCFTYIICVGQFSDECKGFVKIFTNDIVDESGGYIVDGPQHYRTYYCSSIRMPSYFDAELTRMAVDRAINYSDVIVIEQWSIDTDTNCFSKSIEVEGRGGYMIGFFYYWETRTVVVSAVRYDTQYL